MLDRKALERSLSVVFLRSLRSVSLYMVFTGIERTYNVHFGTF